MKTTEKYCWINTIKGEFSNSWNDKNPSEYYTDEELKEASNSGWKLIEYSCLNDDSFEFTNQMKLK